MLFNKQNIANKRGFTLPELLVGVAISGVVLVGVSTLWKLLFVWSFRAQSGSQNLTTLTEAYEHITRVGRLAQNCQKYFLPGHAVASGFQCSVDFAGTGLAIATPNVRFFIADAPVNTLLYQTLTGSIWTTQQALSGIAGMDVCDFADMASPAPSTCALNSQDGTGLGNFITANPNFFRFRLKSVSFFGGKYVNGSFFVRTATLNAAGISYDWQGFTK